MNNIKPLLRLSGNIGLVFGLYAVVGPFGVKAYFLTSAITYHIKAKRNTTIKIVPIEKFKNKKSEQVSLVLDWRKKK